ncbi:hypothetical protein [Micromonospora sp. NPDC126480]|uniref:hypothetical protein n=1 Tax=Micromonospora sp. NPDC126480 TaxID=3155312 RepID=UPI00332AF0EA
MLARVWGGAGDILIPLSGDPGVAEPGLLPFLRRFDPDDVGGHLRTVGDLQGDSAAKAEMIARCGHDGESPETTWDRLRLERLTHEGDWEAFAGQVDAWCSPYRGLRQETAEFRANNLDWPDRHGQSRRGLVTVPATPDEEVVVFDLDAVDPQVGLMVETRVGSVDEPSRKDCRVVRIPVQEQDLPTLVTFAITGRAFGSDLADRYLEAAGLPLNVDLSLADLLAKSPYSHTRRWTVPIGVGYEELPVVCVIGDTAEDHALAMIADRLFKHGAWVPMKLLSSDLAPTVEIALHTLGDLTEDHDRPVLVTSISESIATVTTIVDRINNRFEMRSAPDDRVVRIRSTLHAVQASELLDVRGHGGLADPTAFSVRRTLPVAVADGEVVTLTPLQLPLPEVAQVLGADVYWHIDVSHPGFAAPPRTAIPSKTFLPFPPSPLPDAVIRVSRDGLSYASPNMGFTFGGDPVESRLAQPQVRFPTADELFSTIAARSGARIERSDAGRRAQNALEMWGSFDAIAKDLTGVTRKILDSFLPPSGKKKGNYGIGYAIRNEGFTSLEDLVANLGLD